MALFVARDTLILNMGTPQQQKIDYKQSVLEIALPVHYYRGPLSIHL